MKKVIGKYECLDQLFEQEIYFTEKDLLHSLESYFGRKEMIEALEYISRVEDWLIRIDDNGDLIKESEE